MLPAPAGSTRSFSSIQRSDSIRPGFGEPSVSSKFQTITPIDGSVYLEREWHTDIDVERALASAEAAASEWSRTSVEERVRLLSRAIDALAADATAVAREITWQIGRPIAHSPNEMRGFIERAHYMLEIAPDALAPVVPQPKPGFERFIERRPLGTVVVLAPWNYPFLATVNAIIPALAAGNTVVLKHSEQTPLAAERLSAAFEAATLPEGVFRHLHIDHNSVARMIADPRVEFVCFTGSVAGGHAIQRALAGGFAAAGLELGGKDPAYIRADADLDDAIANIADGIFFNAGQSCCAVERVYVARPVYSRVVEGLVAFAEGLELGDPRDPLTTLGPLVRPRAADFVRAQVDAAVKAGARQLVNQTRFVADRPGSPYVAPKIVVDCDHSMSLMMEETFGPVAGVMAVSSDEEALRLMNDSRYGLTASLWTRDAGAARALGARLETGTVFMNRCDYLDPALAWTGVKDSGRGCTLSRIGYEQLTRPRSFHFRLRA
jgi:acyl-CoA reductase-like NAD-dependent aldehyde dehydrogenase